jgi:hypothetical protein
MARPVYEAPTVERFTASAAAAEIPPGPANLPVGSTVKVQPLIVPSRVANKKRAFAERVPSVTVKAAGSTAVFPTVPVGRPCALNPDAEGIVTIKDCFVPVPV